MIIVRRLSDLSRLVFIHDRPGEGAISRITIIRFADHGGDILGLPEFGDQRILADEPEALAFDREDVARENGEVLEIAFTKLSFGSIPKIVQLLHVHS